MIKKEIYPKTKRVSCSGDKVYITEKLDGSNLVFFKKNDELYIAQRKTIININELEEVKDKLYKGLYQWLLDNKDYLQEQLINDSAICGEWLGMGKLKYDVGEFDKKWYMFAKANIDDEYNLYNLIYEHELFIYPFANQEIPNFIGIVPEITELMGLPTKEFLDSIYETYTNEVKRDVEGFVVNYKNIISKYVRMKNGKLEEHFDRGE
nr:MAG TPA: Naegleria gruberi RNA ligase repair, adenylyltransferase, LIGASE [Caudoviricetes sp.]